MQHGLPVSRLVAGRGYARGIIQKRLGVCYASSQLRTSKSHVVVPARFVGGQRRGHATVKHGTPTWVLGQAIADLEQ